MKNAVSILKRKFPKTSPSNSGKRSILTPPPFSQFSFASNAITPPGKNAFAVERIRLSDTRSIDFMIQLSVSITRIDDRRVCSLSLAHRKRKPENYVIPVANNALLMALTR